MPGHAEPKGGLVWTRDRGPPIRKCVTAGERLLSLLPHRSRRRSGFLRCTSAAESMPKRPPRKAVAPVKDAFLGYRDKIGEVFRSGKDVFVLAVHEQWGKTIPAGAVPARLHKLFGYEGDKLKAYRLDSKYLWCINYPMLQALGQYVLEKIPADILAMMAADHRLVVETNWGVSNAFETVDQDVEMAGFFAPAIPPGAWKHVGKLMLALTPAGNLRKHGGVNYATGFRAWTEQ